ncbi:MAG: UDP-glucose 4-epimerase GalE [Betaproteobacteria bacterium]|nr:UDP-glucose 4-epimerase GalE [Betaproteobacteria bacterium]
MRILVVGGAGYVGSHMTKLLRETRHEPVVLDNLSSGFREAVLGAELIVGHLADRMLLERVLRERRFDAVMHFASSIQVGESLADPARYYRNNVAATLNLLECMVHAGVSCLVFSSSAAVYGEPARAPLDEDHPRAPVNPYGRTKWMVEQVLGDFDRAYGLRHCCLRYFNAAGADPAGLLGERHDPETHLIPLALRAAGGALPALQIFGTDYDTPDGTCIRDYVHVADLCRAHLLAIERLLGGAPSRAYNLGNGAGYSVRQVVEAAGRASGRPVPVIEAPRREGDPTRLVADASRARAELGWRPKYDLDAIVRHACAWEQRSARRRVPAAPSAVRS